MTDAPAENQVEALTAQVRRLRELPSPAARRAIRVAAGVTEADIARVVGVHRETVSRWELGRRTPRRDHLGSYLEVLLALRKVAET